MPITQTEIDALCEEMREVSQRAQDYFREVAASSDELKDDSPEWRYKQGGVWSYVSEENREVVESLRTRLKHIILRVIEAAKLSPLLEETDQYDLQISYKQMSAALRFKGYRRWDTEVLHDEGVVLGVRRAGQEEDYIGPKEAVDHFERGFKRAMEILENQSPSDAAAPAAIVQYETPAIQKYRTNTAFIIMWISPDHPELEDVKDCIKQVFKEFGIDAVRSDEIEHQDVITKRILDEIGTSEFLIADLTGERPSVYYEVGYAHALGKRPILYRKKGTPLHFDLAVHNVPEYENIVDLRSKLRKRLAVLTNKAQVEIN